MMTAMVVYAGLGVTPIFLDSLFAIIATRVGVGLCESIVMTATTTMIVDYYPDPARQKWLASQSAFSTLSSFPLIFAGGWLGAAWGWRGPFAIYLFTIVLLFLIWQFTWEPTPLRRPSRPLASAGAGIGLPQSSPFPLRRMLGICSVTLLGAIMFFVIPTQGSLALVALGVRGPREIAGLSMIASLGIPLGTVLFRLLARLHVALLFLTAFTLVGSGFLLMSLSPNPYAFIASAELNELGCGMLLATLVTWATRGLAFEVRGRATGMWTGAFHAGQFACGLLLTLLAKSMGRLLPAIAIMGVAALAAALVALLGYGRSRRLSPLHAT